MKHKNEDHIYTPSGTDVTERWRKLYGWVPPSELPEFQQKWKHYQNRNKAEIWKKKSHPLVELRSAALVG